LIANIAQQGQKLTMGGNRVEDISMQTEVAALLIVQNILFLNSKLIEENG
jgi:hypothetical protein